MPPPKLECPECGAVLKPSRPVPPGKKVKCPKCGEVFAAPDGDDAPKVRKKPAAKASPVQKAPTAPPKKAHDDDEGPGIYGFIQEEEKKPDGEDDEDEDDRSKKPDLTFALDESVRDPRGPAQVKIVRPSNFLIIAGVLEVVIAIAVMLWSFWPLVFSQDWVDPYKEGIVTIKLKEDEAPPPVDRAKLKPEQQDMWQEKESEFLVEHLIIIGSCVPGLVLGCIVVVGGVKMQNLESYGWAMTACILAMLNFPIGTLLGVAALMTLLDPAVKEGFQYEYEHRKDTV